MPQPDDTISVTKEDIPKLKKLYEDTPDGGTFLFQGKEVLKEYAKYLIEYLEQQLGGGK